MSHHLSVANVLTERTRICCFNHLHIHLSTERLAKCALIETHLVPILSHVTRPYYFRSLDDVSHMVPVCKWKPRMIHSLLNHVTITWCRVICHRSDETHERRSSERIRLPEKAVSAVNKASITLCIVSSRCNISSLSSVETITTAHKQRKSYTTCGQLKCQAQKPFSLNPINSCIGPALRPITFRYAPSTLRRQRAAANFSR